MTMGGEMDRQFSDFWTDDTSVLFTSFWGWSPETWGGIGWTGQRGHTRRTNLLKELTDPFITVAYVTSNKSYIDPALKGMIAGFYLVRHQERDRDEITHPIHHELDPDKWRYSLQAARAFSYLPEYRLSAKEFHSGISRRARSISAMGEVLRDREQISLLQETPWVEVEVYSPVAKTSDTDERFSVRGQVKAGPASTGDYLVLGGTRHLPRELYLLRMDGDMDAFLGRPADGRSIYKIGLSASPDMRRQAFQKAIPRGAFKWRVDRRSIASNPGDGLSFDAAVAGEDAMKWYLAKHAEWLGGEFYLATEEQIEQAWNDGESAAIENSSQ